MNPHLPRLIELQALDLRLADIRGQRTRIPEQVAAARKPLTTATDACTAAKAAADALVKERRTAERELETHESQIEKMKGRTTEIKTNKEYQAHLFEIELAGKKKGEIEERILGFMEQGESLQKQVAEAQAAMRAAEQGLAGEQQRLDALEAQLGKEVQTLEARHQAASADVPRAILDRYTKLKSQRKDQALASLRDGICQGCRLQLPPQLIAEVKRSDELLACDYCRRILYWEGELPAEETRLGKATKELDDEAGESL
ncbi:MAG: C4-type zinc ribbon domain-containing protein [Nitrospiraceae bacterium]